LAAYQLLGVKLRQEWSDEPRVKNAKYSFRIGSPNIGRNAYPRRSVDANEPWCLLDRQFLIDDLEPHLAGGAGNDAETCFVVTRVQVFALGVNDVHHLFARDFADVGLVRLF
jgi:hypothetical protein